MSAARLLYPAQRTNAEASHNVSLATTGHLLLFELVTEHQPQQTALTLLGRPAAPPTIRFERDIESVCDVVADYQLALDLMLPFLGSLGRVGAPGDIQ